MDHILDRIKRLLLAKITIGYYDGELKKLTIQANSQSSLIPAVENFKPQVLIVARGYYQEQLVSYPLTNKKELAKLLSLDSANTNMMYSVNFIEDNQSWVNKWQFNDSLPNARVLIPESLVLSCSNNKEADIEVYDELKKNRLFVANSPRGLYSAKSSRLLVSRELFCQSSGLPFNETFKQIKAGDLVNALTFGLMRLTVKNWHTFIDLAIAPTDIDFLKRPALACIMVSVIYLALTSAYVGFSKFQIESKLDQESVELKQALTLETNNLRLQDSLVMYQGVTQHFATTSGVWQLMLPLFEQANFTQIQLSNKRFVLRGETVKATDVLSDLANMPRVSDAKFDLPVSKNRSKERFTISFVLQNNLQQFP